jgi:predicted nuclease of predicted toxin-antitoxin system
VKILLDENMPHRLLAVLRSEGHKAESVHSLKLAGVKNGDLYRFAKHQFDLLFTKDVAFNEWARKVKEEHRVKYVLVTLPQVSQDLFVKNFMPEFRTTNWEKHVHGHSWPK